jgi:hypothetical protein
MNSKTIIIIVLLIALFVALVTGLFLVKNVVLPLMMSQHRSEALRAMTEDFKMNVPSHDVFRPKDQDGNTTWYIKGTAKDTSAIFTSSGLMTLFHWAADTSGDDSVGIILSMDMLGAHGWKTISTTTVVADSSDDYWILTNSTIPNGQTMRYRSAGTSANKKDSYVMLKLKHDGYN